MYVFTVFYTQYLLDPLSITSTSTAIQWVKPSVTSGTFVESYELQYKAVAHDRRWRNVTAQVSGIDGDETREVQKVTTRADAGSSISVSDSFRLSFNFGGMYSILYVDK